MKWYTDLLWFAQNDWIRQNTLRNWIYTFWFFRTIDKFKVRWVGLRWQHRVLILRKSVACLWNLEACFNHVKPELRNNKKKTTPQQQHCSIYWNLNQIKRQEKKYEVTCMNFHLYHFCYIWHLCAIYCLKMNCANSYVFLFLGEEKKYASYMTHLVLEG